MKLFSGITTVLSRFFLPAALLALVCFSGCQGPFDLRTVLGLELETLTVSPNDIVVDKDTPTVNFSASPAGSYLWTVVSGSGSIDPVTGTYTHMGVVEYVTVQAENPSTGEYGRARIRFESGVSLQILSEVRSLFPGESSELYAFGGNGGSYDFDITENNSIADDIPDGSSTYIAGLVPGVVDTVSVSDGTSTSTTTITVLDPVASIPDYDYLVSSVSFDPPVQLGAAVSDGNFVIQNIGSDGGGSNVNYSVYMSTTADLTGIVERLDSGTVGALGAGASSAPPTTVSGNWPDTPGTYFLVVHLTPVVDGDPDNNYGASGPTVMSVNYNAAAVPPAGNVPAGGPIGSISYTLTNSGSVGGSSPGTWKAYLSADGVLGAGDTEIDSGAFGPIAAPDPIPYTESITVSGGNWPVSGGPYRVILEWRSADDTATPKTAVSGAQTLILPVTNYTISAVSDPPPAATTGSAVSGSFTIRNFGPADDISSGFRWYLYASTDQTYNSGDYLIKTDTEPGLTVAELNRSVDFSGGFWPNTGDDYYLVVVVEAPWDSDSPSASGFSTASSSVTTMTDYFIDNVLYGPSGIPGQQISGGPYSFTINEASGTAGTAKVFYTVYASNDTILGGADQILKSGNIAAGVIPGGGSFMVTFDDPGILWPTFPAEVSIIIDISSSDDSNPGNNREIAGPVRVPLIYPEPAGDGNNDHNDGKYSVGPPLKLPSDAFDNLDTVLAVNKLRANELVQVNGRMDKYSEYDTYGFSVQAGTTRVQITSEWNTGIDDIDLILWEFDGTSWLASSSARSTADAEGSITAENLVVGRIYYIGVNFWLGGVTTDLGGDLYRLLIKGLP